MGSAHEDNVQSILDLVGAAEELNDTMRENPDLMGDAFDAIKAAELSGTSISISSSLDVNTAYDLISAASDPNVRTAFRDLWLKSLSQAVAYAEAYNLPEVAPGIPNIMYGLQTGGPVPGARNQPVVGVAHGGEFILSADVVDSIKKGRPTQGKTSSHDPAESPHSRSGGTQNFYVTVPEAVARNMDEGALRRELKSLQFRAGAR